MIDLISIGIVSVSNIDLQLVRAFQSRNCSCQCRLASFSAEFAQLLALLHPWLSLVSLVRLESRLGSLLKAPWLCLSLVSSYPLSNFTTSSSFFIIHIPSPGDFLHDCFRTVHHQTTRSISSVFESSVRVAHCLGSITVCRATNSKFARVSFEWRRAHVDQTKWQ